MQQTLQEYENSVYQPRKSVNSSLNYSGLHPISKPLYSSTPEDKALTTSVASKFRRHSPHRSIGNQLFDDDSLNTSPHSAGSGNDSCLNSSEQLVNRFYK